MHFLLKTCKEIRNAAAHSSCILNDLNLGNNTYGPRYSVMQEIAKIGTISRNTRSKRMSNARIQQVVTLFYTYNKIVTSPGIKNRAITMIQEFKDRMLKNINYYETNDLIKANFRFLQTIIDNWYGN